MFPYEDSEIVSVCLSQIPLQMSYTQATTCLFCIPSQFVALCNPFRSGNQRHGNLVAEHELRQAATRICRATCMRIQGATRRCDQSRATCMLVCTRLRHAERGTWFNRMYGRWYELDGFVVRQNERHRMIRRIEWVYNLTLLSDFV